MKSKIMGIEIVHLTQEQRIYAFLFCFFTQIFIDCWPDYRSRTLIYYVVQLWPGILKSSPNCIVASIREMIVNTVIPFTLKVSYLVC